MYITLSFIVASIAVMSYSVYITYKLTNTISGITYDETTKKYTNKGIEIETLAAATKSFTDETDKIFYVEIGSIALMILTMAQLVYRSIGSRLR